MCAGPFLLAAGKAGDGQQKVPRRAVACLRTELSPFVCNESPSEGRYANCRSGPRLQKVEPVSHPKAFAFEIGRVGRSCLEEDPLKLGMPAMSIAAGEDALRYS
jgi:hypothetical protein